MVRVDACSRKNHPLMDLRKSDTCIRLFKCVRNSDDRRNPRFLRSIDNLLPVLRKFMRDQMTVCINHERKLSASKGEGSLQLASPSASPGLYEPPDPAQGVMSSPDTPVAR